MIGEKKGIYKKRWKKNIKRRKRRKHRKYSKEGV